MFTSAAEKFGYKSKHESGSTNSLGPGHLAKTKRLVWVVNVEGVCERVRICAGVYVGQMFSAVDAGKVSKAAPSASEASRLVLSGHHPKGRFSVVVVP